MNLVDSSGWLEYFADAPNAESFAPAIEDISNLIVPTISLSEVFKKVYQQRGENAALEAIALMHQGRVIDLTASLALSAAKLGVEINLPLADSIILATAKSLNAILWTQDSDFQGLDGVRFFAKRNPG
jgi:predicted nucleic acid-binding protein